MATKLASRFAGIGGLGWDDGDGTHFEFGEAVVLLDVDRRVLEEDLAGAIEHLKLVPFGDYEIPFVIVHLRVVQRVHHGLVNVDGSLK